MDNLIPKPKKKTDATTWIIRVVIGGAIAFAALNHFQPDALDILQEKIASIRFGSSSAVDTSKPDSSRADDSSAEAAPDAKTATAPAGATRDDGSSNANTATAPVDPPPPPVVPENSPPEFTTVETTPAAPVAKSPKPATAAPVKAPPPPKPVAPKVATAPPSTAPAPRVEQEPRDRHVPSNSASTPTVVTVSVAARPGNGSYANIAKFMGTRNFNVNVREGQRIYARLLPGEGRAQMRIHAPDGTSMTGQSAGQEWDVQAPVSGTYIVRVFTGGTMTYAGQVHITVN